MQTDLFGEKKYPEPLKRQGTIHIGTSGYVFQDWQGPFYPAGLPQNRWLEYYAENFTTVEINATYYRILPASSFEGMVRKTPAGLKFWVKLHADVTHSLKHPAESINQLKRSIAPLIESDRLAGLLAQFPNSFKLGARQIERVKLIREHCEKMALAVEFRDEEWYNNNDIYELAREYEMTLVSVDLPELEGLPQPSEVVAAGIAYIRFHGRNARTWYDNAAGDRYDYDYSISELRAWIPRILRMEEKAPITYMFFNNCHMGQAVKNAKMMRRILEKELHGLF